MAGRFLLDTHTFVWFIGADPRLSAQARAVVEEPESELFLSVASLWEIAIKFSLGKLALARPFAEFIPEQLERQSIGVLGVEIPDLAVVSKLPLHYRDPFDRLIIAQASTRELPIVGVDETFDLYGVVRIW
ncbi:MAG TPA: type II toxin-antitoxin system VapC family toxin [Longimicrobiaceae bacterium]|nr:type II toxin-antitoxin system VapC family toxin [Longimicrobiaceae bacterium]